jgi:hypothetical protein
MIGLAAAAILLAPVSAPADGHKGPLSVVVHASGAQDVSYTIEVHNTTDHAVPDAVITQQVPPAQACATSHGALRTQRLSSWERGALAFGGAGAAVLALAGGARVRRRRRRAGRAAGRAGVEG